MASGRRPLTVGEFINLMQTAQKQYWEWEDLRNEKLFRFEFRDYQSPECRTAGLFVLGLDKIFRKTINKARRNGDPAVELKINPELDVFLGVTEARWPIPVIDFRRRLPLYSLKSYQENQENQSGGSMQEGPSEEQISMALELEENLNEAREMLENSPVSEKELDAFTDMIPSRGGKRHSSRRNKRNKSKKAKKSRRHRR